MEVTNAISVYLDITGVKILEFCADGKNGSEQIALCRCHA